MKFGLDHNTIEKIQKVFQKFPEVEEVVIYGSRAKGNYREGSDIDITLEGEHLSDGLLSRILQEIEELNTPYLFDISIFHKLKSPSLIEHINRVGKVFYKFKEKV